MIDFFLPYSFSNINYDNQSCDLYAIHVWNFSCWNWKICVRCDMAFIEPMHHNKSNIIYLKHIAAATKWPPFSMKMYKFRLRFHWSLFPKVQLTVLDQCWSRWWLSAGQVTSHYLNQGWLIYWCICIYESLGPNELTHCGLVMSYGNIGLGQHGLKQWLAPWQHRAINWTNIHLSVSLSSIHLRAIS